MAFSRLDWQALPASSPPLRSALCAGVALAGLLVFTPVADAASFAKSRGGSASPETKAARAEPVNGPLQIVVSIGSQRVTLYRNGKPIGQSRVSTGVPEHPTPTGVFSIIQKDRYHRSNIYSDAPMPFMERITWSGVALHEGPLPGHPASHGCIRLSHDFAVRLWNVARLGARVIVAHNDVVPVDVTHPRLFMPRPKPVDPGDAMTPTGPMPAPLDVDGILLSVSTAADWTVGLGDTAAGPGATADPDKRRDQADDPAKDSIKPRAAEPSKLSGHVAVFVSRREKKLYVRQGFTPLFETPIEIERPNEPLGTHVFTALAGDDGGIRWNMMTVVEGRAPQLAQASIGGRSGGSRQPVTRSEAAARTANQVLSRLTIPQAAVDRIEALLAPGASLTVSDQGLGPETGAGTDFVVVTGGIAPVAAKPPGSAPAKPPMPQHRMARQLPWD